MKPPICLVLCFLIVCYYFTGFYTGKKSGLEIGTKYIEAYNERIFKTNRLQGISYNIVKEFKTNEIFFAYFELPNGVEEISSADIHFLTTNGVYRREVSPLYRK